MRAFAQDLGMASSRWDASVRSSMRAELDAAVFRLYGLDRNDIEYVMDSFGLLRSRELEASGKFATKIRVLDAYDALEDLHPAQVTAAIADG
jgi:hypothetical protein